MHKKGTNPTHPDEPLRLHLCRPIQAGRSGLFISMGQGTHVRRVLPSYELIVVHRGRLSMYEADRAFDLKSGQALLLHPNREHGGLGPYDADLSFYWAHFTVTEPPRGRRVLEDPQDPLWFDLPQVCDLARPDHHRELFHRYLDERERGALHPVQASLLLTQILFETARSQEKASVSEHAASLAGRVEAFIAAHCHQPLNASAIAATLGYNEDYLGRIFRRAHGVTITEAIHHSQIKLAKSLLQGSGMNIDEVARHSGFRDARYFRRIFRRCEGLTPGAYRRLHSRIHINRY